MCFGGRSKGLPLSKQRLSRWIVDAIALLYTSQGKECPSGLWAHSARSIASAWALASGMSFQDICLAAGWSSPNTFARFYNVDVPSFAPFVLSVQMQSNSTGSDAPPSS